ncbi:MAG: hypothetical protein ACK4PI_07730 [Tepidisphaerales bacterium]
MTPTARFRLWQVTVSGVLGTWAIWLLLRAGVGERPVVDAGGWLLVTVGLLVLAALLLTTPDDAIVLPRRRSEAIILSATGVAVLGSLASVGGLAGDPAAALPGRVVTAGCAAAVTWWMLRVLAAQDRSAWWAVLAVWSPPFIWGVAGLSWLVWAVLPLTVVGLGVLFRRGLLKMQGWRGAGWLGAAVLVGTCVSYVSGAGAAAWWLYVLTAAVLMPVGRRCRSIGT